VDVSFPLHNSSRIRKETQPLTGVHAVQFV